MKVSFQTPNCCFIAEFYDVPVAKRIVSFLPIDSKVSMNENGIYFETDIETSFGRAATEVNAGDIAYCPEKKSVCIFFNTRAVIEGAKIVLSTPVVIIGKTVIDFQEISQIRRQDSIRVMQITDGSDEPSVQRKNIQLDRKLTQDEIDVLVQQLLAEKKKKEPQGG